MAVLTHGTGTESLPLVRSLLEDGWEPSSIAIVQNPVTPDQEALTAPNPAVTVINPELGLGATGAWNAGIRHHRRRGADPILLLTHDVRLRPGAARALIGALHEHPDFGIVGPVLFLPGTNQPFSYGGTQSWDGWPRHLQASEGGTTGVEPCHWIDGSVLAVRAAVIDAVGPYEERFFAYCEDAELCLRARRAGWGVGTVLEAVAEQAPGGSSSRPGAWAYLMCRNGLEYAWLVAGRRAVVSVLLRHLRIAVSEARHTALARWRRDTSDRSALKLAGRLVGVADFLRRRFGPPPPWLPGLGDYPVKRRRRG